MGDEKKNSSQNKNKKSKERKRKNVEFSDLVSEISIEPRGEFIYESEVEGIFCFLGCGTVEYHGNVCRVLETNVRTFTSLDVKNKEENENTNKTSKAYLT